MQQKNIENHSSIFALDIGTRSVIGLLGRKERDRMIIEYGEVAFHQKRVMYDGQIHDIDGVMEIVRNIKEKLEAQSGRELKEVAIAAAGRALKTHRIKVEKSLDALHEISKDLITSLEIEGLQRAKEELESQSEEYTNYFCVGHTVVHYYIDGGFITNPLGHRGQSIQIDILATFLPQVVVDSLYSVMERLGLEITYMTLEPIAAIEAAVPENARLLNLALVDVGAGTSDIAITKEGTITAYGMSAVAGDEITEALADAYLLDFDSAELLKINLAKSDVQHFTDIVGICHEMETEEILDRIDTDIRRIAKEISSNIIEQNGKAPSAVFLVGGGSQTPRLAPYLAEELGLPKERVVVRGLELVKNVEVNHLNLIGPEAVTPLGILGKAIDNKQEDFIRVTVNDEKIKLFQTKTLKVKDALVLSRFNPRNLIPKRGTSINIKVNGQEKVLYGDYGEVAKIFVNTYLANMETPIENGDVILVEPAEEGKKPHYYVKDVVPIEDTIIVNGKIINQIHDLKVNNRIPDKKYVLQNNDEITFRRIDEVEKLISYLNVDSDHFEIKINGVHVKYRDGVEKGDKVDIIYLDGEKVSLKEDEKRAVKQNNDGAEGGEINLLYNGHSVRLPKKNKEMIFVDIFDYIDFDRSQVRGKLVLKLNGRNANYTDILEDGDKIEVHWG